MMIRVLFCVLLSGILCQVQAQQLAVPEYLLYTGKSYVEYPPVQVGSPTYKNFNFDSDTDLSYHGQHYAGRMLIYDLVLDEVVIFHPEKDIPLILPKEWVDGFVIKQDTFVNLNTQGWSGLPSNGYYHKYYNSGDLLCFASYSKVLKDEAHQGGRSRVFNETIRYFVRTNNLEPFQEVSKLRQLLRLDPENRRKNRRALYNMGLHTKDKLGEAIVLVLSNMNQDTVE